MKHEKVPQEKRLLYWVIYESVFNETLNAKRSTCETAGRKIVVDETMPKFQEQEGKELFTMEELCKLRRAETEREKEASFGSLANSRPVWLEKDSGVFKSNVN